jgi:glucose/arabinose dehydrogenase
MARLCTASFASISLAVLLVACGGGGGSGQSQQPPPFEPAPQIPEPPPASPPSSAVPQLDRTVIMSGLESPWDLAFTPDGAMLYTEKCRGLSVRDTNGTTRRLFGTNGSALVASDFFCQGQSGMHGVAVDPDFANNRYVYVFMASSLSTPRTNRVVRLVVNADYTNVSNRTDIVTDIAFKSASNAWGGAGSHSGGRIRFHPAEDLLYVTTGDNHNGSLPQDLTRLGGKVLRVTRDGQPAAGNNTPAGGDARIFTYGHRNVQGVAFRPSTGQPFSCEHGPGHTDEVTPLIAGGNSGWDPKPEAGVSCNDGYCGYTSNKLDGLPTPMTDLGKFPSAMRPAWTNNGRSQGMGPCAFLSGAQWAAWDGWLAVGIMAAGRLDVLALDNGGAATDVHTVTGLPSARIRSLVPGPGGSLFVATDEGEIWRLTPRT